MNCVDESVFGQVIDFIWCKSSKNDKSHHITLHLNRNYTILAPKVLCWALKILNLPPLFLILRIVKEDVLLKFVTFCLASNADDVSALDWNQSHTKTRKRQWTQGLPVVSFDIISLDRICKIVAAVAACYIDRVSEQTDTLGLSCLIQVTHPLHESR